jgi:CRISPR/Cas system-associated exonuclease Cas4 (RecB family)
MKYTLSPTRLNLLIECERCFWLAVVKKVNRPRGPMASIVMRMDSIIKHYFDRYRQKGELPPIIKGVNGSLLKDMPKTLYKKEGNIILIGRPDEYLQLPDGSIVAFDHKTRSGPPDEAHPTYRLQMDVYSYLLHAKGYKTKDVAFLAFYYPDESDLHKGMEIRCRVIKVRTDPARVNALIEKAKKILTGPEPEPGDECEFCKWANAAKEI